MNDYSSDEIVQDEINLDDSDWARVHAERDKTRHARRTRVGRKLQRRDDVGRRRSDGGNFDSVARVRRKRVARIFADKQQRLRQRRRRRVCCAQSNMARQLYKNISMLFLFPVKDGKLNTGVNAIFNASCYG